MAARTAIEGTFKADHITPFLDRLQWLTIQQKCFREQLGTAFRVLEIIYLTGSFAYHKLGLLATPKLGNEIYYTFQELILTAAPAQ